NQGITLIVIGGTINTTLLPNGPNIHDVDFFLTTILHQLSQVPLEGSQGSIQEENRTLGQEWLNNHTPFYSSLPIYGLFSRWRPLTNKQFIRGYSLSTRLDSRSLRRIEDLTSSMFAEAKQMGRYTFHSRPSEDMVSFNLVASTYDHRVWRTGLPVRSAVLKPHAGQLVLWWVTTWES
ncbi:hypothetical protein N7468_008625, partial [Penicillium chermesinum]